MVWRPALLSAARTVWGLPGHSTAAAAWGQHVGGPSLHALFTSPERAVSWGHRGAPKSPRLTSLPSSTVSDVRSGR